MFSRFSKSGIALAIALALLAPSAAAQFAGPGLTWNGSSGSTASSFLPGCSVESVSLVPGETIDITVWGDPQAPYGVLLSLRTGACRTFSRIQGGLALEPHVLVLRVGTLTQVTPCLACPPGFERFSVDVPRLPPGATVAVQALSFGNGAPGFTLAVEATVR